MNLSFSPFPALTTERLILRQLVMSDAEMLCKLRSDASVNRYLNRPKSTTMEEAEAFVRKIDGIIADEKGIYWVICLKEDQTLIGTICLWNFDLEKEITDLGYELSPAQQGKGIMLEAVKCIIDYGFEAMQLKVILALTDPENKASHSLLKKADFEEDLNYQYISKEDAGEDAVYFLTRKYL